MEGSRLARWRGEKLGQLSEVHRIGTATRELSSTTVTDIVLGSEMQTSGKGADLGSDVAEALGVQAHHLRRLRNRQRPNHRRHNSESWLQPISSSWTDLHSLCRLTWRQTGRTWVADTVSGAAGKLL